MPGVTGWVPDPLQSRSGVPGRGVSSGLDVPASRFPLPAFRFRFL